VKILVCGSRTFDDYGGDSPIDIIDSVLHGILENHLYYTSPSITVIEGGARGADRYAQEWAEAYEDRVTLETYPADWAKHGKAAGFIRNQQMLDEGKPDIVVAFVDKPLTQSRGTADMVLRAERAGLPVYIIEKRN